MSNTSQGFFRGGGRRGNLSPSLKMTKYVDDSTLYMCQNELWSAKYVCPPFFCINCLLNTLKEINLTNTGTNTAKLLHYMLYLGTPLILAIGFLSLSVLRWHHRCNSSGWLHIFSGTSITLCLLHAASPS